MDSLRPSLQLNLRLRVVLTIGPPEVRYASGQMTSMSSKCWLAPVYCRNSSGTSGH